MAGTLKRLAGPAYLAAAAADIYTPPASTIYTVIYHIHINNETALAVPVSLWIGATAGSAAGTSLCKAKSVPANDVVDLFFPKGLRMASTDFLSGLAGTVTSLTITVMGDQVVV